MFEYHHTGMLAESIEESIKYYKEVLKFTEVSEIYNISSQKVRVCFIQNGPNSYLELVEPGKDNAVLKKMLDKKITYYHIGYLVNDIDEALKEIKENAYLVNRFKSEAFNNNECAFVYTSDMHLIELINR